MSKHYTVQLNFIGKPLYPKGEHYGLSNRSTYDITDAYFTDNLDDITKLRRKTMGKIIVFDDVTEEIYPLNDSEKKTSNPLTEGLKRAARKADGDTSGQAGMPTEDTSSSREPFWVKLITGKRDNPIKKMQKEKEEDNQ